MGFLDALLGRTKPKQANLDQLFGIPSAAVTLQVAADFRPTGVGSVCFKAAEGGAFARTEAEIKELLETTSADGTSSPTTPGSAAAPIKISEDSYGYTWLIVRRQPDDIAALVTDLHAVNVSLEDAGFGPALLCSLVTFKDPGSRPLGLVYLYKRGTFYPFAPLPGEKRDNALELQVRGQLTDDLRIEPDLSRWFPVWGAPGL
jgi:PspA associated protein B